MEEEGNQLSENAAEEEKAPTFGEKAKNYLKALPKRYFITAFSGMAQGLFVTLIAGTILAQIAGWILAASETNPFGIMLKNVANIAKLLMGAGIGVGIAHSLGHNKLVVFTAAVTGFVGANASNIINGVSLLASFTAGAPGNPIGAYVVTMFTVEVASAYAGKTKLDIILVPLGMLLLSIGGVYISYPFIWLIDQLGSLISVATLAQPFVMGVVIAVVMGILLTMPTSSAAIWIAVCAESTADNLGLYLAGGAAAAGCAAHMVGFAVASFRENGVGGLISQGIGTSMLQIPNIMKKPQIMVPEIIASAIVGPLSTCAFGLYCDATGGGMGTSGLVGVFSTITTSLNNGVNMASIVIGVVLLFFVIPAAVSFGVSEFMRHKGWIKFGDQKLD